MHQDTSIGVLQASQMKTLIEAFLIETDKVTSHTMLITMSLVAIIKIIKLKLEIELTCLQTSY